MSWHKMSLVLRREYLVNFKRPSFLFTAFGVPLLSLASMFLIFRFVSNRETNLSSWQQIGYIDRVGVIDPAGPNPNHYTAITDPNLPVPQGGPTADYFNALEAYAKQQLIDKKIDAYFVIADDYILTGNVNTYARKTLPRALHDDLVSFMRGQIAAKAPNDLSVPTQRLEINDNDYVIRDLKNGKELSQAALGGRLMLPFIFVLLYFMATNTTAQFLMSGVVEEKENRLMEILATSVRPFELLWGKLLGLGALSLTQVVLWASGGLVMAVINKDAREFISGTSFRAGDIALIVVLFLINFLLFAAAMLGIGAAVTAETESRQIAGVFTFVGVLPLMLLVTFFTNPNGPVPVILSFFPLTAATALILRLGLTDLPTWQIALSTAIQVVSVVGMMWLAAKVFRLGMLMYGKPLTPRTLWQALREGKTTLTTASTEYTAKETRKRQKRGLFAR